MPSPRKSKSSPTAARLLYYTFRLPHEDLQRANARARISWGYLYASAPRIVAIPVTIIYARSCGKSWKFRNFATPWKESPSILAALATGIVLINELVNTNSSRSVRGRLYVLSGTGKDCGRICPLGMVGTLLAFHGGEYGLAR